MTKPNLARHAPLTAERLRELLHYDPETGVFTWRVVRGGRLPGEMAGSAHKDGSWVITISGRHYRASRVAWLYCHGVWPTRDVDHRDTDNRNNRIDNLRLATVSQNQSNRGRQRNNTSGLKGVFASKRGRWRAQIRHNNRSLHIGCFATKEEARAAYILKANEIFGEFAR